MGIHNFKQLDVWRFGKEIAVDVYRITRKFPREELFSLTQQIRRAAVSIPSNVAEGFNRNTRKEISRFVAIALGSSAEVETQLQISFELGYVSPAEFKPMTEKIQTESKMLRSLQEKLNV